MRFTSNIFPLFILVKRAGSAVPVERTLPSTLSAGLLHKARPPTHVYSMKTQIKPQEINSGVLVCQANSFLVDYRISENCDIKPAWHSIIGYMGIVLSVLTGIIIIIFFRNYEFGDQNALKRRFSYILILQLLIRFSLTFFFYQHMPFVKVYKHFSAHFIGVTLLYDFLVNWPFKD